MRLLAEMLAWALFALVVGALSLLLAYREFDIARQEHRGDVLRSQQQQKDAARDTARRYEQQNRFFVV